MDVAGFNFSGLHGWQRTQLLQFLLRVLDRLALHQVGDLGLDPAAGYLVFDTCNDVSDTDTNENTKSDFDITLNNSMTL